MVGQDERFAADRALPVCGETGSGSSHAVRSAIIGNKVRLDWSTLNNDAVLGFSFKDGGVTQNISSKNAGSG